ncbi:tetratricopeptide repeat protein [Candidatus Ruminimicrobiellum ovillum]|uniref:tetratricopeptide repeat protein n=1 Tax=Candidatus Ruminimicrobiellum ovillum TaxID=1947927 RepID=UPI003559C1D9
MKFKMTAVFMLICFLSSAIFADKSILYMSDSVHVSDYFNTKYIDMLQSLIDDDFGKGTVNVSKITKFDMNTTQCLEICDVLFNKKHQDTLILNVGDSNYHNLYGFAAYMKNRDRDKTVVIRENKNLYEINNEMLKLYGSTGKNTLTKVIGGVYNSLMGGGSDKTFKPKVVPNFYVLNSDFTEDNNFMATIKTYEQAWQLIRDGRFDEAKIFLSTIIEKKPSQSMLYYALGSTYLTENSEGCEAKALQCFEDGILVDPLNKLNLCYKGLELIYMLYKGEITADVLFFARGISQYITFPSESLEAIMSINTVDYDEKIQTINDWILSDIDKIRNKAFVANTNLIFVGYPDNIPINSLLSDYAKNSSKAMYMENDKINVQDNSDFTIYSMAKKIYDFLTGNRILIKK